MAKNKYVHLPGPIKVFSGTTISTLSAFGASISILNVTLRKMSRNYDLKAQKFSANL